MRVQVRRARAHVHEAPRLQELHRTQISCFIRFSLLCSVFKLMPSISAARVLLLPAASSVATISLRSASSTVIPGAIVTPLDTGSTLRGAGPKRGRCCGSMNSPRARIVARSMTLRSSRTLPGQS